MPKQSTRKSEIQQQLVNTHVNYFDTRSKQQIEVTNLLARSYSAINLHRLHKSYVCPQTVLHQLTRKQDWLYVCLQGIVPFVDEFKHLDLPGQMLILQAEAFQFGLSEEQRKERWKYSALEIQATNLKKKIDEASLTKQIVFVFHSYGTYIVSTYFRLFSSDRVVGMVDIGGTPIRFYTIFREFLVDLYGVPIEFIEENIDIIHEVQNAMLLQKQLVPFGSKYMTLSFLNSVLVSKNIPILFQNNKYWPAVLKCFIYGRKDNIFEEPLLNEKSIFYTFQTKLPEWMERQLRSLLFRKYGVAADKPAQAYFIYNLQKGTHSCHQQKQYRVTIAKIVKEYLETLEELGNPQAKL